MPLDPLAPVQSGDPGPIPTSAWNRILELVRRETATRAGRSGGGPMVDGVQATVTVLVQNSTGSAASHGYCLSVDDIPNDATTNPPEWLTRPVLTGGVPSSTSDAFVVLLEPAADGAVGRAAIAGLVIAQVDVTDTAHEYATPTAADATKLTSAASGPARLLWTETGSTGTQACVLSLLGGGSGGSTGGSIRVQALDGSPVAPSATTIKFDEAEGFYLAGTLTAPQVGLNAASDTTQGTVSLADQQLGLGNKAVKGLVLDEGDLTDTTRPAIVAWDTISGFLNPGVLIGKWDPASDGLDTVSSIPLACGSLFLGTTQRGNGANAQCWQIHHSAGNLFLAYYPSGPGIPGFPNPNAVTSVALSYDGVNDRTQLNLTGVNSRIVIDSTYYGQSGTYAGLEFNGGVLTGGTLTVDLTSEVTGALPAGNGGIGLTTTPPAGSVLAGDGSGYVQTPAHILVAKWTLTV